MAAVSRGGSAVDRHGCHARHNRFAARLLSSARDDTHQSRPFRRQYRPLHRFRAFCPLDDGNLFHPHGADRSQHHIRQSCAVATDRTECILDLVAGRQIRAQFPELPIHARRYPDLLHVARRQYPEQGRRRLVQAGRRHRRRRRAAGLSFQRRTKGSLLACRAGRDDSSQSAAIC